MHLSQPKFSTETIITLLDPSWVSYNEEDHGYAYNEGWED